MSAVEVKAVTRRGVAVPHLRAWRLWAGLSRDDLGAMAGLSGIAVRNMEWGRTFPLRANLARLASAFGMPADILQRCAPADTDADYWAREVAVKFARERAARRGTPPRLSLLGGNGRGAVKSMKAQE